jgi:hypothetical protein
MTVASSPASKNGRGIRAEDLAALAPSDGLFKVRTGNQWLSLAKEKPIPQMLCDQLWHQNEVAILFAPSGVGKSILAMQIADSVSRGRHILYDDAGEPKLYCQTAAQKVLYIDCELSEKQFENRYSNNYTVHEKRFTAENVVVCRIAKPKNFVGFQFIEFGNENDHLRHYDQKDKAQLIQSAKEMYGAGKSQREIANELGKSVGTINAYLKS